LEASRWPAKFEFEFRDFAEKKDRMTAPRPDTSDRGYFVVFEGVDKSGKTTQSKKLVENLKAEGWRVQWMRFPDYDDSDHTGPLIRRYLLSEVELHPLEAHLVFCANRMGRMQRIKELLYSGVTVVCDRYVMSGIAYSMAKNISERWCKQIETSLVKPDLTVFTRLESSVAAQRANFGVGDRHEKVAFLDKVVEMYEYLIDDRDAKVLVVPGTNTILDIEKAITERFASIAGARLNRFTHELFDFYPEDE